MMNITIERDDECLEQEIRDEGSNSWSSDVHPMKGLCSLLQNLRMKRAEHENEKKELVLKNARKFIKTIKSLSKADTPSLRERRIDSALEFLSSLYVYRYELKKG